MFQNKCIYFIIITAKILMYHYLSTAIIHWKCSAHNLGHSLWWIHGYFVTFRNFSLNNLRQISIHNLKKDLLYQNCKLTFVHKIFISQLTWDQLVWVNQLTFATKPYPHSENYSIRLFQTSQKFIAPKSLFTVFLNARIYHSITRCIRICVTQITVNHII